jgi:chaperonin GroES
MRTIRDYVLIKPIEDDKITKSGIIIPDTVKESPTKGVIVSVGDGIDNIPLSVVVGDKVMFSKYDGTNITIDDEEYIIIKEENIFMVL